MVYLTAIIWQTGKNVTNALWYYQHAIQILDKIETYIGKAFDLPKLHIVETDNLWELGMNMWGVIRVP